MIASDLMCGGGGGMPRVCVAVVWWGGKTKFQGQFDNSISRDSGISDLRFASAGKKFTP
jgi:hypothetical protein